MILRCTYSNNALGEGSDSAEVNSSFQNIFIPYIDWGVLHLINQMYCIVLAKIYIVFDSAAGIFCECVIFRLLYCYVYNKFNILKCTFSVMYTK